MRRVFFRAGGGAAGPIVALSLLGLQGTVCAQDLEPRRWAHLPAGTNVAGVTYGYTAGDVAFDPLLQVDDATVEVNSVIASYTHAFDLAGKTGRVDVLLPYQVARWDGLLQGVPTTVKRQGPADPWIRLSVGLTGAPALRGADYAKYRAQHPVQTLVGVALAVMLPLGEYEADKLLNLGQNRFIIRPQAGVVHSRGPWSFELTGSVFFYTDNDDFFGGLEREQEPTFALQTHVIRSFQNRSWVSASVGYGIGGESVVDGVPKGDDRGDLLWALSAGLPVGEAQALKLTFLRYDNIERVGSDTGTLLLSWNLRF